jgi:hypothetical protein
MKGNSTSPRTKAKAEFKSKLTEVETKMAQELGNNIDGMSLNEAQSAIAAAQKMLDDLKAEQALALKNTRAARDDVDNAKEKIVAVKTDTEEKLANTSAKNNTSPSTKDSIGNKVGNTSTTNSYNKSKARTPAEVMAEIQALVNESASARAELVAAREEVDRTIVKTKTASKELDAAVKEKDKIAAKLDISSKEMAKSLDSAEDTAQYEEPTKPSIPQKKENEKTLPPKPPVDAQFREQNALHEAPLKVPKVVLSILESSEVFSGGFLDISYQLTDGQWDNDDALLLKVVVPATTVTKTDFEMSLYTDADEKNDANFETLEFTVEPTCESSGKSMNTSGIPRIGCTRLALPAWACYVNVCYVRTTKVVVGQAIRRTTEVLATLSTQISVTAEVYALKPEDKHKTKKANGTKYCLPLRRSGAAWKSGYNPNEFTVVLEHLRNINTVSICISPVEARNTVITRGMAWAVALKENSCDIMLEVDLCTYSGYDKQNMNYPISIKPVTMTIELPVAIKFLDFTKSQIEFDKTGRFSLRFPLHNMEESEDGNKSVIATYLSSSTMSLSKSPQKERNSNITEIHDDDEGIECCFCGNELVNASRISEIRPLPTGVFDNFIHEFLCSEDIPTFTLTTSDMATPAGYLLEGPLSVNICPVDVASESVNVECKAVPTLLDLLSGQGGVLATVPTSDGSSAATTGASVIDMATCMLSCSRCQMYVGDGKLLGDTDDPFGGDSNTEDDNAADATLNIRDVSDVRLARHCITLPSVLALSESIPHPILDKKIDRSEVGKTLHVEQALSRCMVHLMNSLGVSTFVVMAPTSMIHTEVSDTSSNRILLLRVLSKEYAVATNDTEPSLEHTTKFTFAPAIKISYSIGTISQLSLKGNETRIPLQYDELDSVCTQLASRSCTFGPSIFKGQSMTYAFL